jgi:hypothetical protein
MNARAPVGDRMKVRVTRALKTMPAVVFIVLSLAILPTGHAAAQVLEPTTTLSIAGTPGNNGWYTSNVVLTLSAVGTGGFGINRTDYGFSYNSSTWKLYTGPINITNDGTTTVFYRSIDNASHAETVKVTTIKIDKTPPTLLYTFTPALKANGWSSVSLLLHFEASDATSGLREHSTDITLTNEGTYSSLSGHATDDAGNTASVTIPTFYIDKTPPAVGSVTVANNTYADVYIQASAGVVEANPDRVEMDWGDGTISLPSISENVVSSLHAYKQTGKYTVTLTVVDMAGNVARSSAGVTVNGLSGQATPTPEPTPVPAETPTPSPVPGITPSPAPGMIPLLAVLAIALTGMALIGGRKRKDGL